MTSIGQSERATQARVIGLFRDELGYRYLGDWTHREGNSHIEEGVLTDWLKGRGVAPEQIVRAIELLKREADHPSRNLYGSNKAVYGLLRYGVQGAGDSMGDLPACITEHFQQGDAGKPTQMGPV